MTSQHPEAIRARARRAAVARQFPRYTQAPTAFGTRAHLSVDTGVVLVGSDAHIWPGPLTTAMRAFIAFCRDLSPAAVILNGDMVDGARISRWGTESWVSVEHQPLVVDELAAVQAALRAIVAAAPYSPRYWTLGNHDARFEKYLIEAAPEMAGVHGTRLKDHFPDWIPALGVWINAEGENAVVVKHRWANGAHAIYGNVVRSGLSMVTGHLHALNVRAYSDYRGTRWGVDGGMLGAPYDRPFIYMEDNPEDHRSGFVVLTFVEGRLMWPEVVWVVNENAGLVNWRGRMMEV